ncbi:hypothetical protein LGK97_03635 [Clostridium sp. CS001]|uniref:hypothetical protein n=1 Tax=Clostridium sp. CS001 TaxID=2880648 RepID=UPI001CF410B5|nr:hypothetical protein [Clostridium sp. CS001]MCB2288854.1 hypothetical protein [Clostridium sp. CS001]
MENGIKPDMITIIDWQEPVCNQLKGYENLDNKSHVGTGNEVAEDGFYKKVLVVDGNMLNTADGYLYFKRQIEKEIEKNPNVRFIN